MKHHIYTSAAVRQAALNPDNWGPLGQHVINSAVWHKGWSIDDFSCYCLCFPWRSRDVIQDLMRQNVYHESGFQKGQFVLFCHETLSFLGVMVLFSWMAFTMKILPAEFAAGKCSLVITLLNC